MLNILKAGLQFFADGGAGEGAPASGTGLSGDTNADIERYFGVKTERDAASQTAQNRETEAESAAAETDEDANEAPAEPQENPLNADEEYAKDVGKGGKYEEAQKRAFQKAFNGRFAEIKKAQTAAESERDALYDAIDPVLKKLGIDKSKGVEAIAEAIMNDRSNFSKLALDADTDVDDYIEGYKNDREKARADEQQKAAEAESERQQEKAVAAARYNEIYKQAEELKATRPDFNLAEEIKNTQFAGYLSLGLSVRDAFRLSHYDSDMAQVAGKVAEATRLKTAQSIRNGQQRPAEGSLSRAAAVSSQQHVADFSDQQILDILEQVQRGARISF